MLSIRDMLRARTPAVTEPGASSLTPKATPSAPPSAWAKPDVQLSKAAAGGQVVVAGLPDTVESAGKMLLHDLKAELVASAESLSKTEGSHNKSDAASISSTMSSQRGKGAASQALPQAHTPSTMSLVGDIMTVSMSSLPPPELPPKDYPSSAGGSPTPGLVVPAGCSELSGEKSQQQAQGASSFANTLTNSLSYALRFVSTSGRSTPRGGSVAASPPVKAHHGLLLSMDGSAIEERPHIKYEVMVGRRLKFACTVYYARQFELLRKRCGVDDVFVKSLSRSRNWAAEGGKSRANFWKTSDDRFIIKTLVNAWNVADL